MNKLHKFTTVTALLFFLAGCGGGGGSGSSDSSDSSDSSSVEFPIPTLPAGAAKIEDPGNAANTAYSALLFSNLFSQFVLKTEGSPSSIPQVIKLVTDQVIKRNRNPESVAARETDDLSTLFCDSGTATDTYTENTNSITGQLTFSDCVIGGGLVINGSYPYEGSFNGATLDFNIHLGGSLIFSDGVNSITSVLNLTESGNDGTGDFSLTQSFSLEGIPGGGYLVTTVLPLLGNSFSVEVTSGELSVQGADNTQLCLTVTAINLVTVEFDDGLGGGCVPLSTPLDIPI